MNLFFLRHGDAEHSSSPDSERKLTDKGEQQIKKIARLLEQNEEFPDVILSSPYRRAKESAEIVSRALDRKDRLFIEEKLSCGCVRRNIEELIRLHANANNYLFVGHAPDFGNICAELLGLSQEMEIKKGGLVKLETQLAKPGSGKLCFSLYPSLL